MLKIRRPLGRLIFNMGIAIPGKIVFLIETAPWLFSLDPILVSYRLHVYGMWFRFRVEIYLPSTSLSRCYNAYTSCCVLSIYYVLWIYRGHSLQSQTHTQGIILCVRPANERRHYIVTSSLIGWAHAQNHPRTEETEMSSFWRNFRHKLPRKLSFWQLSVQPVAKISSSWHLHMACP